ncbi:MAG TPA: DUF1634 domain-containing protein [Polyangia bacterium]|nr:DUF1634 domain-containing protein [Polyangia bacterium]
MTPSAQPSRLERRLATFLSAGTWLACVVIAVGLALAALGSHVAFARHGLPIVTAGIALLVLLPVGRVLLMLVELLRVRDYRLAAVAGCVLAILAVGFIVGARH